MEYLFSDRVQTLKSSATREVLKPTIAPGMISLPVGNPAPETPPVTEIGEILSQILRQCPINALQYNVTEGYPSLYHTLTKYMKEKHGVGRDSDDLLITLGV